MNKFFFMVVGCAVAFGLCGCSNEEQPHRKTVAEIQDDIAKVQANDKMPAQAKKMVLNQLYGAKDQAKKEAVKATQP